MFYVYVFERNNKDVLFIKSVTETFTLAGCRLFGENTLQTRTNHPVSKLKYLHCCDDTRHNIYLKIARRSYYWQKTWQKTCVDESHL